MELQQTHGEFVEANFDVMMPFFYKWKTIGPSVPKK